VSVLAFELTEEQKKTLSAFLKDDERDKLIEGWLKGAGISPLKAKLVSKVVLPVLGKLVGGIAMRGAERVNDALRQHWTRYDEFIAWASHWLLVQIDCKYKVKEALVPYLKPIGGLELQQWERLDDQTRVWINQLEQLNFIALGLGKLEAKVSLRIDEPGPLDARQQPSRWLRAYNAFIPLIGREIEYEIFRTFCEKENFFSWKVFIGKGGVGKTRLAIELAKEYADRGWVAGFISEDGLNHFVKHDGFNHWTPVMDTLIIVDYAATKLSSLKALLNRCAELALEPTGLAPEPTKLSLESTELAMEPIRLSSEQNRATDDTPRLRLLLLERHADKDQGWLSELRGFAAEGRSRDEIKDAMEEVLEIHAPGHKSPHQTMVKILHATMKSWEKLTGKKAPDLPSFDESALRDITRSTGGRPLYLQMAALYACIIGSAGQLLHWGQSVLLKETVNREIEYIKKQTEGSCLNKTNKAPNKALVTRAAALLCLTGPRSRYDDEWLKLLKADAQDCGYTSEPGLIADALIEILGEDAISEDQISENKISEDKKKISPIYPDLLGEAFAVWELGKRQELLSQSLRRVTDIGRADAWNNLLRATADLDGIEGFEIVRTWLEPLVQGQTRDELILVESLLPEQSVALADFSLKIEISLLKNLPDDSQHDEERALILNKMGKFYSAIGRRQEALDAAKRALDIRKRLVQRNPDAFEPDLAGSLNTLGNCYSGLGRRQEALDATKRAGDIYERLAQRNPDGFEPDLAGSLNNLGVFYLKLGRWQEALDAAKRAVDIRERLAIRNPDGFEPNLAVSLNNLGNRYSELGRWQEALDVAKRAVDIRERLVQRNPDGFEPDLAGSLNNLGNCYSAIGRRQEALDAAKRAVDIRERLAQRNSDAFEPDLALSLGSLGRIYLKFDAPERAKEAFGKGIRTLSRLFLNYQEAFAGLMGNLSRDYMDVCKTCGIDPDEELLSFIKSATL